MTKKITKSLVKTFGCRLNLLESELIEQNINSSQNKTLVVNTCAVTNEAVKQAKQFVRKTSRENPGLKIIATGCAVQTNFEEWSKMPEIFKTIGNTEKLKKETWQNLGNNNSLVSDIMIETKANPFFVSGFKERTRAFLQIQQGCDHRCTFCIIPFGRGNSRSVPVNEVIDNAQKLIDFGHNEIVLTGVDITSWGKDLENRPSLGSLVKLILKKVIGLKRLRLSSIDPAEIDFDLMDALSTQEKLMPHLHLSIQHGNDLILKRMKRRHLARDVVRFVEQARKNRPGIVLGADFISGFPTENCEAHLSSLKLINDLEICWGHIFPYSPRNGSPAAKMPQIESKLRKDRAKELRIACNKNSKSWMKSQVGSIANVLMESGNSGRCEYFSTVKTNSIFQRGTIQKLKINKMNHDSLQGVSIENHQKEIYELV
tara:strand:- start:912 stop:2198 length:1287 start_codon:yes stop_codon:yes gene_type:complete